MKRVNLFTTFHKDKDYTRYEEYSTCILKNLELPLKSINFLADDQEQMCIGLSFFANVVNKSEVKCVKANFESRERRPTYNDFFELMDKKEFKDDINILCNADIYLSDLDSIEQHFTEGSKICLALSRWDMQLNGGFEHFSRADSQDTWIFDGNPNVRTDLDFGMGVAGCDNRLAWELEAKGFDVRNPSSSIKTYHIHISGVRNYINGGHIERIPAPYKLVTPY